MSKRKGRRGGPHRTVKTPSSRSADGAKESSKAPDVSSFRPLQICERGHVTLSPISIGSGCQNIQLSGNVASCGQPARIEDGRYSFIDGIVRIVQTSEDRTKLLEELLRVSERASRGELSTQQAFAGIEDVLDTDGKRWWKRWRALNPREWGTGDWLLAKEALEQLQANLPGIAENVREFVDGLLTAVS